MDALLSSYQNAIAIIMAVLSVGIPLLIGVAAIVVSAQWALRLLKNDRRERYLNSVGDDEPAWFRDAQANWDGKFDNEHRF